MTDAPINGESTMTEQTYEGMSFESFEDAAANALRDVPGTNEPQSYEVTLRYSRGGITPPQFHAALRRE
jgi:hypothetical protein